MIVWLCLVVLGIAAIAATARLGLRDGWVVLSRTPRGRSPKRTVGVQSNYAGIAEVARFAGMRRRIGFHAASQIMATLAARVGEGDGFEVRRVGRTAIEFLYRAEGLGAARQAMRTLKAALEAPIAIDTIAFEPEVYIGSNPILDSRLPEELFDAAASAVEDAAKAPERIFITGDLAVLTESDRFAAMLFDLRTAIHEDGLDLHYMPKLRLHDERIACAEALCRWTHPQKGAIPAQDFIQWAEDAGLIGDLTLWAVGRAVADQERLLAEHGIVLDIDVNLSGQLLGNPEFCSELIATVAKARGRIGIEITETAVIQDAASALANLERIRAAGIHIAIDDFGTGLSSFAYLRNLPANELKIDQMFVRALTTSNRDPLLVRSAIEIAHALEMEVTAEGVEDEIALALLRVMRCDHVQGYHISKPLPFAQLTPFLRNFEQNRGQVDRARIPGALAKLRQSAVS